MMKGYQILHTCCRNKLYTKDKEAVRFVERYLQNAKSFVSDAQVLKYSSDCVSIPGIFLELGVFTGKTINFIAALNPLQTIYGFDSFEGLPEDWIRPDKMILKGAFAWKNSYELPFVLHNVVLKKGWFEESLVAFISTIAKNSKIAFLHIDCDLYSSTKTALTILEPYIVSGTILVFDEFYNYPNAKNHEYKAFEEFLARTKLQAKYFCYNRYHEQVAIKMC